MTVLLRLMAKERRHFLSMSLLTAPVDVIIARMIGPNREKLHALTALRFVAAMMIVMHHAAGVSPFLQSATDYFHLSQAVSFFFVLSGFILTYVYPSLDAWTDRRRFWRARLARVWPGHVAAFALLWILLHTPANFPVPTASVPVALLNLSMVHAWIPVRNSFYSFNPVAWTISTEFAFYLLFPLLIYNLRKTWWVKLGATFLLSIVAVRMVRHFELPMDDFQNGWRVSAVGLLYVNPLARLFEFVLGMTMALFFRHTVARFQPAVLPATVLELATIGIVLVNMHFARQLAGIVAGHSPAAGPAKESLVVGPMACVSFAGLIYVMALHAGIVSRVLSLRPAILLGEISYAVYLIHYILLTWYEQHAALVAAWPGWLVCIAFGATLLGLAWLVWIGVERPMRRWIVRGSLRRKSRGLEPVLPSSPV